MPRRAVLGQFRLFDYDVLSADDIIGTVYVHCNSLYEAGEQGKEKARRRQIHGWFPVYDTMRGICGELQVTVYIQHIMDFNPVDVWREKGNRDGCLRLWQHRHFD